MPDEFSGLGKWTNPYIFSLRRLIDSFLHDRSLPQIEKQLPSNEKMDFIFDDKSEKSLILSAWDEVVEKFSEEMRNHYGATPRFENDQEFLGLQAADLWASWVRHWYEEDSFDPPDRMKNFDFMTWRGQKRGFFHLSMQEDHIVSVLHGLAMQAITEGDVDPITLSGLKGEF